MDVRVSGLIEESIVDGPGLRFVMFLQGCAKRCFMCHNPETHAMNGGDLVKTGDLVKKWQHNKMLKGITISGGEPFLQPKAVYELTKQAIDDGLDVIIYSGYYYEELKKFSNEYVQKTLDIATLLIDGPFEHNLKSLNISFRGSTNQRIVDLAETKLNNEVTFHEINWDN